MTDLKKKITDYDLLESIADNSYLLINQSGIEYKVYASNFKTTIVDNLTTESAVSVLSASQGKELKRQLDYNTATRFLFNYENYWTITNDGNDVDVVIPAGEIRLPNNAAYSVATASGTIPEDGGLKLIFNPLSNSFSYSFLSSSTLTGITEGETDNEYIIIKNIGGVLYTFNASLGLFINVISHNDLADVEAAGTGVSFGHVTDQSQIFYGVKTFEDLVNFTSPNDMLQGYATIDEIDYEGLWWDGTSLESTIISRDDTNGTFHLANDTVEISSTGIIKAKSETASTISSFDADKNIKSLSTTTYPSLVELAYVKGVTSAIQTQFAALTKGQTSVASSATPSPVGSKYENEYYLTALAADATFAAPSGTPANGNTLLIRIEDNGTARALAWNAIYEAVGVTLPTTTILGKKMYIGFIYNSNDAKWDCVSVVNEV